jgi:hypothetical protein
VAIETNRRDAYLDANLAQVAQSPCDGRHGGGSGQFLPVMCCMRWNLHLGWEKRSLKLWVEDSCERGKSSAELIYRQAPDR